MPKLGAHFNRLSAQGARLYHGLFPALCFICETAPSQPLGLCSGCYDALPHIHCACDYCGLPVHGEPRLCGRCAMQRPVFDALFAPCRYDAPLDRLIKGLKYAQRLEYVGLLSRLLLAYLAAFSSASLRPAYLIPVPVHVSQLRRRGFNQSLELARALGKALNIPVVCGLTKIRHTLPQSALSYAKRRHNLQGVFAVNSVLTEQLSGKHVAVVDDVVTTGATVSEAVRVLKKQTEVTRVDVWCVARTV